MDPDAEFGFLPHDTDWASVHDGTVYGVPGCELGHHGDEARYNQFSGDPVTGLNIQAFNFGYFLPIGQRSRLSFDYQFKNHPSFEDDAVNGRFQITWGILLK